MTPNIALQPRDWPVTTYFVIGLILGGLTAFTVISGLELASWAQILIALLVPIPMGLLAAVLREDIFLWLVP